MLLIDKPDDVICQRNEVRIRWGDYQLYIPDRQCEYMELQQKGGNPVWGIGTRPPTIWELFKPKFLSFLKISGAIFFVMAPFSWLLLVATTQDVQAAGFAVLCVAFVSIFVGLLLSGGFRRLFGD